MLACMKHILPFLTLLLLASSVFAVSNISFIEGYSGTFVNSETNEEKPFSFYVYNFNSGGEPSFGVIVDGLLIPKANSAYDYDVFPDQSIVMSGIYTSTLAAGCLDFDEAFSEKKCYYEVFAALNPDGSLNTSKTLLAVVPPEYYAGRPETATYPYDGDEPVGTTVNVEVDNGYSIIEENGQKMKKFFFMEDQVCFQVKSSNYTSNGLCPIFKIEDLVQFTDYKPEDIPFLEGIYSYDEKGEESSSVPESATLPVEQIAPLDTKKDVPEKKADPSKEKTTAEEEEIDENNEILPLQIPSQPPVEITKSEKVDIAVKKIKDEGLRVQTVEPRKDSETIVYIEAIESKRLFGFIPIDIHIEIEVNTQTGQESRNRPFWSFLAWS